MHDDLALWLTGSLLLFGIGIYIMIAKKDGLKQLVGLEMLVIAANAVIIGMGYIVGTNPLAQTMVILSIGVGGAIVGTALVILTGLYRYKGHVDTSQEIALKW